MDVGAAKEAIPAVRRVLHVGCGGDHLPATFNGYAEVRMDIDPETAPDIVADMTEMGDIGEFDAVYCSHALEHLSPHEVPQALAEFMRVLKPEGYALIFVPDLENVSATEEPLFVSPAGTICGLDLIYGFREVLKKMPYMAHRTGFTAKTMAQALEAAGFSRHSETRLDCYNLMAIGVK